MPRAISVYAPSWVTEADLAILCQCCGLCCDGSLFGRVHLEAAEVEPARRHRLRVLRSTSSFEQPCAALERSGPEADGIVPSVEAVPRAEPPVSRRCAIYDDRPLSCRRFTCRLYERHRREGGPLENRLAVVRRIRELVASLETSGFSPDDFEIARSREGPSDPRVATAMQTYLELTRSLENDFARVC